jgi:hypothetical protein
LLTANVLVFVTRVSLTRRMCSSLPPKMCMKWMAVTNDLATCFERGSQRALRRVHVFVLGFYSHTLL